VQTFNKLVFVGAKVEKLGFQDDHLRHVHITNPEKRLAVPSLRPNKMGLATDGGCLSPQQKSYVFSDTCAPPHAGPFAVRNPVEALWKQEGAKFCEPF